MPYILNDTSGKQIAVIQDGTINSTVADLTFVGKNYSGYGQVINENFLQLLENFANPIGPAKPVIGELWWDTSNKKLNVNVDGTVNGWKKLAIINNDSAGFPLDQTVGDLYWDKSLEKLYVYDGTQYILIGPIGSASSTQSGTVVGTIVDNNNISETVLLQQLNNDVPAIIASPGFTLNPDPAVAPLNTKFPIAGQGITLQGVTNTNSNSSQKGWSSANSGYYLWGTAQSAIGLVRVSEGYNNVHFGDDFLLKSELANFSGSINVATDDGIYIGQGRVVHLHVTQNTIGNLSNIVSTRINFNVTKSGTLTEVFHIDGSTPSYNSILPNASVTTNLGASGTGNNFNNLYATNTISATLTAPGATVPATPSSGNGVITGNWVVNGNFTVGGGGSVAATTAGTATYANALLGSDGLNYFTAKTDGTNNAIVQYSGTGALTASALNGKAGSGQISGAWTVASGSTLQATSLLGSGSTGYVTLSTSGSNNSIVQRDGAGGITGVGVYGAFLQSPNLNAGSNSGAAGTINGQWSLGQGANLAATSLLGTGGAFQATTSAQVNTIAQRDSSGGLSVVNLYASGTGSFGSTLHVSGDATFDNDLYGNTFHGVATSANYADLAENYSSDSDYEPGTVLVIGGEYEVTECNVRATTSWAGIVSTNPAHLMNNLMPGVAVALKGRVPCKVVGPINKGDLLVTSATPGYAEAYKDGDNTLAVIGRALENAPDGLGVVEVKV